MRLNRGVPSLNDIISSPEFFPFKADLRSQSIEFVRMSKQAYRTSSFLDDRIVTESSEVYRIRVDDLMFGVAESPIRKARAHLIMHGAFSLSTQLSRLADCVPGVFSLREPLLLTQLASWARPSRDDGDQILCPLPHLIQLAELCFALLCRTFEPEQVVIIKGNDICNLLGEWMLRQNDELMAVYLMVAREDYIVSILKDGARCRWVRERLKCFKAAHPRCRLWDCVDPMGIETAVAAALVWQFNDHIRRDLTEGDLHSRVRPIDGEYVASKPRQVLEELGAMFNFSCENTVNSELEKTVSCYAKRPSKQFSTQERTGELATLRARFRLELDRARDWMTAQPFSLFDG